MELLTGLTSLQLGRIPSFLLLSLQNMLGWHVGHGDVNL